MRLLLSFFILLYVTNAAAQRGTVSGVLTDDGGPLPGAAVVIKETKKGTQTDFDGNYTIECNVGDVLLVSFVGYATREIVVTPEMMGYGITRNAAPQVKVGQLKSTAYIDAVRSHKDTLAGIPSLDNSPFLYTKEKGYRFFNHIKDIKIDSNIVRINHFSPEYFIDGAYSGKMTVRSMANGNLPNGVANPFATVAAIAHNANATIFKEHVKAGIALSQESGRDSYDSSRYDAHSFSGNFSTDSSFKLPVSAKLTYHKSTDRFANINGYQNLVFAEQSLGISDLTTILKNSNSQTNSRTFATRIKVSKYVINDFELRAEQSLLFSESDEKYRLDANTFDYENGYASQKQIDTYNVQHRLYFNTDFDISDFIGLTTTTSLRSKLQGVSYDFDERFTTNPITRNQKLSQHIFEIQNVATIDYDNFLYLTTGVIQTYNSRQQDDSFIPQVSLSFVPTTLFYGLRGDFLNYINIAAHYGETASPSGLLYTNYSHNNLPLAVSNANDLLNNNDLFFPENLALEKGSSYEYALDTRLFNNRLFLGATYEHRKSFNGIFPIYNGASFELTNVANTETKGFDIDIKTTNISKHDSNVVWETGITLSRKRTKTTSLLTENSRVPIAGFASINTNLIPGASAGVIVGSAFARNAEGEITTDINGNPTQAETLQIIGDPTPNFNLGLSNTLTAGRWEMGLTLDYQNGGDIWNATQKALDGFEGVDERYIEDAGYLNLKSLAFSYEFVNIEKWRKTKHYPFFKSLKVSGFAHNLITKTSFKGASPYSALFDGNSAQALNYFNTPLATEVGVLITTKF